MNEIRCAHSSWVATQKTLLDRYYHSNRKSAIFMRGVIFGQFMPTFKMISSYSVNPTVFTFTQYHLHWSLNLSYLVGVAVETIFFPRWEVSSPSNFQIQCLVSTTLLLHVDSVALNMSTRQYKVSHFEFGSHFEILLYIILSWPAPYENLYPTSFLLAVVVPPI